jgi:hypothetical protein
MRDNWRLLHVWWKTFAWHPVATSHCVLLDVDDQNNQQPGGLLDVYWISCRDLLRYRRSNNPIPVVHVRPVTERP